MTWLPVWAGWIFIVVALLIAVPSARIALVKRVWGKVA
ncbi:hypothetical protein ES703_43922 [subsurface metagenome]